MKIGVMGAGAVGCFVGGKLLARGGRVVFVGRERGRAEVRAHGMTLGTPEGPTELLAAVRIDYAVDVQALAGCEVVLCAVKSEQTKSTGKALAGVLAPGTLVVSLQNGVHNADVLRAQMPGHLVLGGIVGFNVVAGEGCVFRRATTGPLALEWTGDSRLGRLREQLEGAGFDVEVSRAIREKQWTKLVINASNALSALSGVPTRELIFDVAYRRLVRAVLREATSVLRAAKVRTARLGPLPISWFPFVLGLPTPLLRVVVGAQLRIDPEARSSMWQDLSRRRRTEVEMLNGEFVRLAASCGARAPLNQRLVELVHEAEVAANGSPNLSAASLARALSTTA